jgi:chromosome segregation ATPase
MSSVQTITQLGCGPECQQRQDVAAQNDAYLRLLETYKQAYAEFQRNSTDANRAKVDEYRKGLDDILSRLTSTITAAQQAVDDQTNKANSLATSLEQKTASLNSLSSSYTNKKALLASREKQIEFAVRRAKYSRMIMGILVTLNVIILLFFIGLLYTRIRQPTGFQGIRM